MHALIDGDILPYEFGGLKKRPDSPEGFAEDVQEGEVLPFEICWGSVGRKIEDICNAVNADKYTVYLSSQDIPTWRFDIATILPYKGSRGAEKPTHWADIRANLELHHPCVSAEFIEADDAMSIAQYIDFYNLYGSKNNLEDLKPHLGTVICTRDKDLRMVPGWHYGWSCGNQKEQPLWFQSPIEGLRCFYKQLITGDMTDNILGLYGVGKKSTLLSAIDQFDTEQEMFGHVFVQYVKRFGKYAEQFITENGQLLWMQETQAQRWCPRMRGLL